MNHVVIDNYGASKKGTRHLIDNGFKNIAFISIDTQQIQMLDRAKGYQDAVDEAGLSSQVLELDFYDIKKQEGKNRIKALLTQNDTIDAVFFSTNYLTLTALGIIKDIDDELIDNMGILTFDDNDFFKINTPSISAVAQPLQEMAEEMMRIMFKLLKTKEKDLPLIQTVLETTLIPRDSSKKKVY